MKLQYAIKDTERINHLKSIFGFYLGGVFLGLQSTSLTSFVCGCNKVELHTQSLLRCGLRYSTLFATLTLRCFSLRGFAFSNAERFWKHGHFVTFFFIDAGLALVPVGIIGFFERSSNHQGIP